MIKPLAKSNVFFVLMMIWSSFIGCQPGEDSGDKPEPAVYQLNFRPVVEGETWQLRLVAGEASWEPLAASPFGLRFRLTSPAPDEVVIRFEAGNSAQQSPDYPLTGQAATLFFYELSPQIFRSAPATLPNASRLAVHFDSQGQDRDWGLHVWDPQGVDWTTWGEPLALTEVADNESELSARLPLPPSDLYAAQPPQYEAFPDQLGLIVHAGNDKSVASNQFIYPGKQGRLFFLKHGDPTVYCTPDFVACPQPALADGAKAHWLSENRLVWHSEPGEVGRSQLLYAPEGGLIEGDRLTAEANFQSLPLVPLAKPYQGQRFPHLQGWPQYRVDGKRGQIEDALRSQLYAVQRTSDGELLALTKVQIPGVLDDIYRYDGSLGLDLKGKGPMLRVWAPTAQDVALKVYSRDKELIAEKPMNRQTDGVWQAQVEADWLSRRLFYRFGMQVYHYASDRIERYDVTDPYSVSLAADSKWSQFVDLTDSDLKPDGWEELSHQALHPADISILELHIRDFSIADQSVPEPLQGTYQAFGASSATSQTARTRGQQYLASLVNSGLTHVQVLPANDFTTVLEAAETRLELSSAFDQLCHHPESSAPNTLKTACEAYAGQTIEQVYRELVEVDPTTPLVQEYNSYFKDLDGFNWGYDPYHYGVPEGSYATDPDGAQRILEFREMVAALSRLGLSLSLDVVYNHTHSGGLGAKSVLDRVVPGYYHRRDPLTGQIENSTCCSNTASEHAMMEKLMIDTLQRWHQAYKVAAFRFDLMGHHMKANMLRVQKALGSAVYLYGEGWNFGEVANNQRGINATQLNMSATGIGSFNDRFRDAVRGGGAFDCGVLLYQQGYGNGLYTDLNEAGGLLVPAVENPDCLQPETFQAAAPAAVREQFMALADRIRVGLVGSIKDYEFETVDGTVRRTDAIPYGGGLPTGYTTQPYESINYISKHDNQTLWDINQLKLPQDSTMAERIQAQEFGISLNLLAQGVPFFQLGIDLLRSKSLNRDSYNSGDWFNRVDYTGEIHNWNIGLPSQEKDGDNWPFIRDVVEAFPTRPGPDEIASMQQSFRKWLAIRYSSRLFRMRSAAAVKERLRFLNTGPKPQGREGLIHMKLHDESCRFGPKNDLDAGLNDAVVIVNPYPRTQDILAPGYRPHGLLADDVLRRGKDRFTIKARSTAVFIRPETAECRLDDVVQIL